MTSSACQAKALEALLESLPENPWPFSVPVPTSVELGLRTRAAATADTSRDVSAPPKPQHPIPQLPPRCASLFAPERFLGGGAYGEVWLARHRATGEQVALKMPRPGVPVEPDVVRRFLNEARVTATLDHPSVVRVKAHGIENGTPWIAYEYLGDNTVYRRLCSEGKLSPIGALQIAVQVASALEEAHAHGVIHRDLKPANIIEHRPGEFKLFDFGLAAGRRPYAMSTGANLIVGTPAYLAPEQVRGDAATESTDQYGLGLVLYQLLTGVIPQHDEDVGLLLRRRSREVIPSVVDARPELPDQLVRIVDRMLERKPECRFDSLRSTRRALADALQRLECPATPRTPTRLAPVSGATPRRSRATPAKVRRLPARNLPKPALSGQASSSAPLPAAARVKAFRAGGISLALIAPLMVIGIAVLCWFQLR